MLYSSSVTGKNHAGCLLTRQDIVQHRPHPLPVRTFPEYALTRIADREMLMMHPYRRREAVLHQLFLYRTQRRVAVHAQRKWPRAAGEIQAVEDLAKLLLRLQRVHETAVRDRAALEQFAVASDDDAAVAPGWHTIIAGRNDRNKVAAKWDGAF